MTIHSQAYGIYDLLPEFPRLQRLSLYDVRLNVTAPPEPNSTAPPVDPNSTPKTPFTLFGLANPAFFWEWDPNKHLGVDFEHLRILNLGHLGIREESLCRFLEAVPQLEVLLLAFAVCQSNVFMWGRDDSPRLYEALAKLKHLRVLDISGRNLQPSHDSVLAHVRNVPLVYASDKMGTLRDAVVFAHGCAFVVQSPASLLSTEEDRAQCKLLQPYVTFMDAPDDQGQTLLMQLCSADAASNGSFSVEAAQLLLEMGASVHARVGQAERQPSRWKPEFPHAGVMAPRSTSRVNSARRRLGSLSSNGDPSLDGFTALHFAASAGRDDMVTFLLAHGAQVNARSTRGVTPLTLAAVGGSAAFEALKVLLAKGATVNELDVRGWSALHYAAVSPSYGTDFSIGLLVAHGADMELVAEEDATPALMALLKRNFLACRQFHTLGARVPPLFLHAYCAADSDTSGVLSLESYSAQQLEPALCHRDANGDTALLFALKYMRSDMVNRIFRANGIEACFSMGDSNDQTPLHWVTLRPDCRAHAQRLIDTCPALIKAVSKRDETALQLLCRTRCCRQDLGLVDALISTRDLADTQGFTPLHGAALVLDQALVARLLHFEADASALDGAGYTPLMMASLASVSSSQQKQQPLEPATAALAEKDKVVAILYAASTTETRLQADQHGRIWLHLCVSCTRVGTLVQIVQACCVSSAEWNAVDSNGVTPFMLCCALGLADVVKLALEAPGVQIDLSAVTSLGFTAATLTLQTHASAAAFSERTIGWRRLVMDSRYGSGRETEIMHVQRILKYPTVYPLHLRRNHAAVAWWGGRSPLVLPSEELVSRVFGLLCAHAESTKTKDNNSTHGWILQGDLFWGVTASHVLALDPFSFLYSSRASWILDGHFTEACDKVYGRTCLHFIACADWALFAKFGANEAVAVFVAAWMARGFNPNIQDRQGNTALHLAMRNCSKSALALLRGFPAGALEVNVKNHQGCTALHYALGLPEEDSPDVFELLCFKHRADVSIHTLAGATPLELALQHGHSTVVINAVLGEVSSFSIPRALDGFTAFHLAALVCNMASSLDVLALLFVTAGRDVRLLGAPVLGLLTPALRKSWEALDLQQLALPVLSKQRIWHLSEANPRSAGSVVADFTAPDGVISGAGGGDLASSTDTTKRSITAKESSTQLPAEPPLPLEALETAIQSALSSIPLGIPPQQAGNNAGPTLGGFAFAGGYNPGPFNFQVAGNNKINNNNW